MSTRNKIACVVVTFNRLQLLQKCVNSLRKQTYKSFDIVIVNNDSTDGTKEWLEEQTDLIIINQANLGGAGGFYSGTKWAFDHGYEWIWMMDDDGQAHPNQLNALLDGAKRTNSLFVNALVCNIEQPDKLTFGLSYNGIEIQTLEEAQNNNEIPVEINPFNGTMINREVISNIGFIKKEMFVWGDEFDYTYRARRAGFEMYTITNAIHYHPASRAKYGNVIPFINRFRVVLPPKSRRRIKYRNMGYIHETYYNSIKIFKTKLMYSLYYLCRLDIIGLIDFHSAFRKGQKNNFD